jgi:hypothetical protein
LHMQLYAMVAALPSGNRLIRHMYLHQVPQIQRLHASQQRLPPALHSSSGLSEAQLDSHMRQHQPAMLRRDSSNLNSNSCSAALQPDGHACLLAP